ncbi:MAG: hypothetical protein F4Z25_02010 [Chloroflexi bacterium]|nr:hypothetical protein [Chloroflexota bacterium]
MTDPGSPRIVFADELLRCLQEERGWLGALDAGRLGGSGPRPAIESTLKRLERLTEAARSIISETRARYPEVLERCPVVLGCSCPSLTTIHALHLAAFILVQDIALETKVERKRLSRTGELRRARDSLEWLLGDYRLRPWESHSIAAGVELVREEIAAAPLGTCDRCAAPDVFGTRRSGRSFVGRTRPRLDRLGRHGHAGVEAGRDARVGLDEARAGLSGSLLVRAERDVEAPRVQAPGRTPGGSR